MKTAEHSALNTDPRGWTPQVGEFVSFLYNRRTGERAVACILSIYKRGRYGVRVAVANRHAGMGTCTMWLLRRVQITPWVHR